MGVEQPLIDMHRRRFKAARRRCLQAFLLSSQSRLHIALYALRNPSLTTAQEEINGSPILLPLLYLASQRPYLSLLTTVTPLHHPKIDP